ncbi:hypothetical protein BKA82DRAFT_4018642 [Pisolithus tinctorius]|nr:hypothetical protein BKA82DRAFT_4018642 [Pisolithus tinctorius]
MVLVPVHTYTVDLLPGGQAGQAWYGITSGWASMALALGWHSWHWCWDSLTDGLMALGMCQDSLHDGLMALGMCQNIWHRTHYNGARMACMMDLWHWGYARIHGTGARPASMALVWCQYTLQWCQNGLHDGSHGIGDVPEHMA